MVEIGQQKQCRKNPPIATMIMTQGFGGQPQPAVLTYYPEVSSDMGCTVGETKPNVPLLS
jgi:hypothetical protein